MKQEIPEFETTLRSWKAPPEMGAGTILNSQAYMNYKLWKRSKKTQETLRGTITWNPTGNENVKLYGERRK